MPCVRDSLFPPKSGADGCVSESRNTAILESSFLGFPNLMESTCWLFGWAQNYSQEGNFVGILLWGALVCISDCTVHFKIVESCEI